MIDIPIVYEDDALLVINKPAGVIVNRAETVKSDTVQDWAEQKLGIHTTPGTAWGDAFESRAGIAHRIDKETSGLLMVAKNDKAHKSLSEQLKEHSVTRRYVALVLLNIKHSKYEKINI